MRELDSNVPLFDVRTIAEHLEIAVFIQRMVASLLGAFGALALLLATIGLYGVIAALARSGRRRSACAWRSAPPGADHRRADSEAGLGMTSAGIAHRPGCGARRDTPVQERCWWASARPTAVASPPRRDPGARRAGRGLPSGAPRRGDRSAASAPERVRLRGGGNGGHGANGVINEETEEQRHRECATGPRSGPPGRSKGPRMQTRKSRSFAFGPLASSR